MFYTEFTGKVTYIFHLNAIWQLREVIILGQLEKKKTEARRLQASKSAIHLLNIEKN